MTSQATHKQLFYTEMAKLLEAGFDIRKAAQVLLDTKLPAPQAVMLAGLNEGLYGGRSISDSFSSDPKIISDLERHLISAGERGGKLAPAFQHLADYFGMVASTRAEAIKSMVYPIIVLHMGLFIGSVPGGMMKGETSVQIISGLVVNLCVIYALGLLLFFAVKALLKAAPTRASLDRQINRLPWIGKARRNLAMARFCKVYHSCVLAGISMEETVKLATQVSYSGVIREAGAVLLRTAKSGNPLGPQFLADAAFPKAFARSYATGEEAGTLDTDLALWSKRFQDEAEASARTLAVMLPKVLYFIILGFVAWRIIGFYGAYYSGLEHIGDS
jgi:type IV pilus assembly protein PilC